MITKNFKNFLASILCTRGTYAMGWLPIKTVQNQNKYTASYFGSSSYFPSTVSSNVRTDYTGAGVQLGSGTTPATENDYRIETPIGSTNVAVAVTAQNVLDNDDLCVQYDILVTNNRSSDLTIAEIGYAQTIAVTDSKGSTSPSSSVVLFDRTVLDTPVEIPAGEQGTIRYRLKVAA